MGQMGCRLPGTDRQVSFSMSWTAEGHGGISECAVPSGAEMTLEIRVCRFLALSAPVSLVLCDDFGGGRREIALAFDRIEGTDEIYKAPAVVFGGPTLYFCELKAENMSISVCAGEKAQLLVYDGGYEFSPALRGGIMYQIFPDRFFRSPRFRPFPKRGTVMRSDWDDGVPKYAERPGGEVDNNDFFGGSLYGVTDRLDYLVSLGITAIYLNPIFDAHTNHKYDTSDYEKVDQMLGGKKALGELLSEAEKRGISVILDGVFNHTGADSRYFNRYGRYKETGAYQSKSSPYYDWYDFRSWPDDYACWWGVKLLPATREDSSFPQYIEGVVSDMTGRGISGWRLDVADELSDGFIRGIAGAAREKKKDAVIIGEVWEDASNKVAYDVRRRYLQGGELDSVMNYPMRSAIVSLLLEKDAAAFARRAGTLYSHYPRAVCDSLMNFLGTHDTMRIINTLSSAAEKNEIPENAVLASLRLTDEERKSARRRVILAWLICATMYGVPCVYYGDEIGMEGWRDPFCRLPMKWNSPDEEILEAYRGIDAMRRYGAGDSFVSGKFDVLYASGGALIYRRGKAVVCVNAGDDVMTPVFPQGTRMIYPEKRPDVRTAEIKPLEGAVFMTDGI